MEALLALLGMLVLIPLLVMYSSFTWGYILLKFWGWFLLPVFPMLPYIGFWQAVGLSVFLVLFKTHQVDKTKSEYQKKQSETIWLELIGPWVILLCGWFIHLFTV